MALAARQRGAPVAHERILAIGDSVRTDLHGAAGFGIPCLFVAGGIHSNDFTAKGGHGGVDFGKAPALPLAVTRALAW